MRFKLYLPSCCWQTDRIAQRALQFDVLLGGSRSMKYDAVEVCCVKCHAVLRYTSSPCTMIQVVLYRAEEGNACGAVLALASLCSCKPVQTESSDDIIFVCPLSTVPSSSSSCIVL